MNAPGFTHAAESDALFTALMRELDAWEAVLRRERGADPLLVAAYQVAIDEARAILESIACVRCRSRAFTTVTRDGRHLCQPCAASMALKESELTH